MLWDNIRMSWSNIRNNKIRSFLTVLGIVIGIASIIALVTIVQGATSSITGRIMSLGANKISIHASGTPIRKGLSESELAKLAGIDAVMGISPTVTGKTAVVHDRKIIPGMTVQGKNDFFFRIAPDNMASGRGFNYLDIENRTQVAVLGSNAASKLFMGENPVGSEIQINGLTYTVVGILRPSGIFSAGSTDNMVILPYTSAQRVLGVRNIIDVDVFTRDVDRTQEVMNAVNGILNEAFNYRESAFYIYNMQDMINTVDAVTGIMSLLLAGIASISLIVGGIGIMNMMLVSVTERTSEIGLRKALGAEPVKIQVQFLMESIFLSLFGGIIGCITGALLALAAASLIGFTFKMAVGTILISVGFSAAIGIVFGIAPARKASRLSPIEALRHV